MKETGSWIDITYPITEGMLVWPGDAQPVIRKAASLEHDGVNVTDLSFCAHTGTHMDAPLHFLPAGRDITELDPDSLIGLAQVIEIRDGKKITSEELRGYQINRGSRVLFRTVNSSKNWTEEPFRKDYVHLDVPAAQHLADLEVKIVGVDYLSVGGPDNNTEVHRILLSAGITILEGLDMRHVTPGNYDLVALPMKIRGADGAPARVLIRRT